MNSIQHGPAMLMSKREEDLRPATHLTMAINANHGATHSEPASFTNASLCTHCFRAVSRGSPGCFTRELHTPWLCQWLAASDQLVPKQRMRQRCCKSSKRNSTMYHGVQDHRNNRVDTKHNACPQVRQSGWAPESQIVHKSSTVQALIPRGAHSPQLQLESKVANRPRLVPMYKACSLYTCCPSLLQFPVPGLPVLYSCNAPAPGYGQLSSHWQCSCLVGVLVRLAWKH